MPTGGSLDDDEFDFDELTLRTLFQSRGKRVEGLNENLILKPDLSLFSIMVSPLSEISARHFFGFDSMLFFLSVNSSSEYLVLEGEA